MAKNDNDKLAIAYYVNAAAAKAAADDLMEWDKHNDDVELGAVGIVTLNRSNGEIEVDEIGERHTKHGALWGTGIGLGLAVLSGGLALIPGLIGGAAIGGGLGYLNHKSLGMTDEDVAKLADHLKSGGAALGVMCDDFELAATTAKMVQEGGRTEYYELAQEAKEAVADVVEEAQEAEAEAAEVVEVVTLADLLEVEDEGPSLLELGSTPHGRSELEDYTGIDDETILQAVEKQDLKRIGGIGNVYADLLHASGVATVPDLARRNPANLAAKMGEVNEKEHIVDDVPDEETVAGWIDQAGDLDRVIEY
jgi:uncharacterized membrane protein